ncbi:hypothetical protein [Absidia glauca]|uniref:DH domain-containing protein n=1 Tax=Absidia glauca TaxID=4829 RepID=A0A163K8D2_ABSGL|nr:hypothetical protein [Absidia glauca]
MQTQLPYRDTWLKEKKLSISKQLFNLTSSSKKLNGKEKGVVVVVIIPSSLIIINPTMQYHSHPSYHYHYSCSSPSPSFCPCQLTPLISYCQPHRNSTSTSNSTSTHSRCLSSTVHHHYHYLSDPSTPTSSTPCCNRTSTCKNTLYTPLNSDHSCNCKTAATAFTPSATASSTTGSMSTHTSKTSSNTIISGDHNPTSRRHNPPNRHQLKPHRLLTHAIQELILSERDYVDELYRMVEICLAVLHQQKWASSRHVAIMSRNLSEIYTFHQRLLTSLRVPIIMQDQSDQASTTTITTSIESKCRIIARAFLDHQSEFMTLYTEYCEGHSEAWRICTDYRSRSEWPDFMMKCQELIQAYHDDKASAQSSSPGPSSAPPPASGKRVRFEDFLIKPIQRICRYQLLLKEIVRHANQYASHPASKPTAAKRHSHQLLLAQAFDCMHTIATEIDRQNEAQEAQERTHRFLERLDSDWRLAKDRVAELGCVVISGALDIRYQNGGGGENSPVFNDQHAHEVSPSFPSPPPSPSATTTKSRYLGCFVFSSYIIIVQVKKQTLCVKEKQTWVNKIRSAKLALLPQHRVHQNGLVSSLSNQPPISALLMPGNRQRQPSPPLLRSSTTLFESPDQHHYHPHRSNAHLPSSSSSPSLPTITHYQPLSIEGGTNKKKKNRSLSTHIASSRYPSGPSSPSSSPTFSPTNITSTPRRHSSLDLFSMATQNLNRVSLHFKTQHRNALRDAVDQRIRDVCTRDYLSSRARHLALDRKTSGASAMVSSTTTSSTSSSLLLLPPSPPVVAAPTSTAISSISSASSSAPYYYGNQRHTPSPTFVHPLTPSPLSFKSHTPTQRTKEPISGATIETLPLPSGKARGLTPRLKSLWHRITRALPKKKKKKEPQRKQAATSDEPPAIIHEEEEERVDKDVQRTECLPLPSSPSAIMYSDFQLYRRSLNLD